MTENRSDYPNVAQSFVITGMMIAGMLLFSPLMLLGDSVNPEALSLIYEILAVGTPCLIAYAIRKKKTGRTSFNLSIENRRIIPLIAIAAPLLLFGIVEPISALIPMPDSVRESFVAASAQRGIFTLLYMVVAAPILEEILFRGLILDGLLRAYSPARSILLSSFLFGIAHLNPWQFVAGLVMGLFLGWVYCRTGSLVAAIMIHAAANFSAFCVRLFADVESLMNAPSSRFFGGSLNYGIFVTGSALVVWLCVYLLNREFARPRKE